MCLLAWISSPDAMAHTPAEVSFMGMWPGHSHGAYVQKDPTFGLRLCCHCFEILNNFWIRSPFSFCSGLHKLYSQFCSCQIASSLWTCIYDCMGSFQDQLTEEEKKNQAWFMYDSCKMLTLLKDGWLQNCSSMLQCLRKTMMKRQCPRRTMMKNYPFNI